MDETLKIGFFIHIPDWKSKFALVSHLEPLIYETSTEFSAVATGGTSGGTQILNVQPREDPPELYELIPSFRDGLRYYIKIPSGNERFKPFRVSAAAALAFISSEQSPQVLPNPDYTFWMVHSDQVSVDAHNQTGYTKTPKIYFKGTKYNILPIEKSDARFAKLEAGQLPYFVVPRGGLKT